MPHHPDSEHLDTFVRGLDTSGAGYLLHLLDCARCSAEVRGRLAPIEQRRGALALARPIPPIWRPERAEVSLLSGKGGR